MSKTTTVYAGDNKFELNLHRIYTSTEHVVFLARISMLDASARTIELKFPRPSEHLVSFLDKTELMKLQGAEINFNTNTVKLNIVKDNSKKQFRPPNNDTQAPISAGKLII
jgi:hypothetical protein